MDPHAHRHRRAPRARGGEGDQRHGGRRGARGEAPENTIAGARHAVERGVRHLEIDLRLSKDGELVVVHDNTVNRTTGLRGKIGNYTASELAAMDARADGPPWPNKRKTGIPRLTTLVNELPEIVHWQLELKSGSQRYNDRLADAVVAWLAERDEGDRFAVTSSEPTLLTEVNRQRPEQVTGLVSTLVDPTLILASCGCDMLAAHWSTMMNPFLIRQLQRDGIHISIWTQNDGGKVLKIR